MDTNPQSEKPPRFENLVWRIFLICGQAGLSVVAIYLMVETHELGRRGPIYQGKRLSSWMVEPSSGSWPRQSLVPADEAIRQLADKKNPTRETVPQTSGRISMQRRLEVIPVLTTCLQDTNPMVRYWAEDALKVLGASQQTTATKTP